jgi:predicted dehydrogenase
VTQQPVAVGLAGAGPWATAVHAPTLAAGPETRLAGVWSRTRGSAERLAAAHGVAVFDSFEKLVKGSDAIAFAVPPAVQAELAVMAARNGRAVLLEKPLAADVASARRLADAIDDAGVGSVIVLTYRFNPVVREFLAAASRFEATGARACFLSGAFLSGPFAGGWRAAEGAVFDVGPHLLDLVEAAVGPVESIAAAASPAGWTGLLVRHDGGAVSDVAICCSTGITPSRTELELYGRAGSLLMDGRAGRDDGFAVLRAEFAAAARAGGGHPLDARHGVRVQELVDAARRAVAQGGSRVRTT